MPERPFSKQTSVSNSKNTQHYTLPLLFIIFLLCYQLEVPSKGVTIQGTNYTVKDERW